MVIYGDLLFLLNALVDYLLILAAARLCGQRLERLRFALAAGLGGCYAVAIFLPGGGFLEAVPCKLSAAALMLVVAYGGSRHFWRQSFMFFALTCGFGGGVFAIGMLGKQSLTLGRGIIYSRLDVNMILLSAAISYAGITTIMKGVGKHSTFTGELVAVELEQGARKVAFNALMDTGNTLADPVSGRSVMVAEGERLAELFPPGAGPDKRDLADPAGAFVRLCAGGCRGNYRLIPYRAVGVEHGFLLAVYIERCRIDGQEQGRTLVALSPTPVSDGGNYCALIPAQ